MPFAIRTLRKFTQYTDGWKQMCRGPRYASLHWYWPLGVGLYSVGLYVEGRERLRGGKEGGGKEGGGAEAALAYLSSKL